MRSVILVPIYKCKNSVFCVLFFLCYCFGTISGVFVFRVLPCERFCVTSDAVTNIFSASFLVSCVRPLVVMAIFAFIPVGYRAVFPMVFIRAFLFAFVISAVWNCGGVLWPFLLRCVMILPLYYVLSRWVYFRWDRSPFC